MIRSLLWWLVLLFAAFVLFGFFIAPLIAKPILEKQLSEALHREVKVQALRANPFLPSVAVRGFVMASRVGDVPVLTFDELYVNAGWSSIVKLAPVVDQLTLTKPHLRLIRNSDGTYNLQDLFEEALARMRDDTPTTRFAAFNLQLVDGYIEFEDRVQQDRHEIEELRIGVPVISSLPSDVDITVAPELSAQVNGAPVGVKGELLPFQETRTTAVEVNLDKFNLARLVDYLPFEPRAEVKSARLDTRLVVRFEQPIDKPPLVRIDGTAALTELKVHDLEDRPMVACPRILVDINEIDALAPIVDLKTLVFESPDIHVRRDASGVINLDRAGHVAAEGDRMQRQARKETGKAAVAVKFGTLAVKSGRVRFTDETTDPAYEASIQDVRIETRDFDNTLDDRSNHVVVRARTEQGESFELDVDTIADPRGAEGRLKVSGLALKGFQPYLSQVSNMKVDDGRFDIGFDFQWASDLQYEKQDLQLSNLGLALQTFRARLADEKQPLFRVEFIKMNGAGVDLGKHAVNLGTIKAKNAAIQLRRENDGSFNLAQIVQDTEATTGPSEGKPAAKSAGPWTVDLRAFSLEDAAVVLEDLAVASPVGLRIAPVRLKAENLSTASGQRGSFDLHATIGKRGKVAASGPLVLNPLSGRVRIDAQTVDFALAQPYIDDRVQFVVKSGAVSAKGSSAFGRASGDAVKMSYKGDVRISDFVSVEKPKRQVELIKWKSLSAGDIQFDLEPLKVALNDIELTDFYGRVVVSPDGRINLQDLVNPSPGSANEGRAPKRPEEPRSDVQLGSVQLRNGTLDFSDLSIEPSYRATLREIDGSLTAMTREKASTVQFRAAGQRAAEFAVRGKVNALTPNLYLDIEGAAKDVELPPLSMYAAKYVGYRIERGKLTLNVNYRLENRKLEGNNNIVLQQLTLGDKADSPDALDLPLPTAVAVLRNRQGTVDINVPISGSLDDPEFSISGAILQAFGRIIVKAAAAPFALLGAAFGGGAELSYIEFEPGSADLDADDIDRLENLVQAMRERPNVNIDIMGRADPVADRKALGRTRFGFRKKVSDEDLQRLAAARAEAARSWMVNEGNLPPGRVFLVSSKLSAEGIEDKGKSTRVDFRVK